ncbi:BON domain-containing protein [Stieleria varia]|uniref:Osmotically-inducible protein Y n=1 Tax=Stieleria varia TaxID=2528005 RepID=A0A5C6AH72_9BACT|nr:BON domain-containing protein [Stieleria varia]TWT98525.1 Osmotically-inducible protein Y precursor [Stieleria varia]
MKVPAFKTIAFALALSLSLNQTTPSVLANEPASGEIVKAIEADLADAERIVASEIDVKLDRGVVTLGGTVNSILDRDLASEIAKRTRGVQAVVNQILVQRSDRSDDSIHEDVQRVLITNSSVDEPQIVVAVNQGEVSMTGEVDSLAEKRIAGFVASGVRGVVSINNQLTVAMSSDRTDTDLRDEISALIHHSVYLDDVEVEIAVDEGVVKLTGNVHSALQKDHLERIAEIWGVAAVDVRNIRVDPTADGRAIRQKRYESVTDESIKEALQRAYRVDPILFSRADAIEINVSIGRVSLSGSVDRLRVKNRAEKLAGDVIGVRAVSNNIELQLPGKPPTDIEIVHETQDALARSAHLDRRDIRVHSQAAHVSLYGVVESELEKRVAQWVADGVTGVVHVNNSLAVEREWEQKSDEQIKTALERKLRFAFYEESDDLSVDVQGGVAIIKGTVDTWRQWQTVMDLAIEAGSRHPHNLVNVQYHPPHGASDIYVPH